MSGDESEPASLSVSAAVAPSRPSRFLPLILVLGGGGWFIGLLLIAQEYSAFDSGQIPIQIWVHTAGWVAVGSLGATVSLRLMGKGASHTPAVGQVVAWGGLGVVAGAALLVVMLGILVGAVLMLLSGMH